MVASKRHYGEILQEPTESRPAILWEQPRSVLKEKWRQRTGKLCSTCGKPSPAGLSPGLRRMAFHIFRNRGQVQGANMHAASLVDRIKFQCKTKTAGGYWKKLTAAHGGRAWVPFHIHPLKACRWKAPVVRQLAKMDNQAFSRSSASFFSPEVRRGAR